MEKKLHTFRYLVQRVLFFFPIQLILAHLKRSHILIVYWLLLYGFFSGKIAAKYGVFNLVLYPEYLGDANFLSHIILGLAYGSFAIAFQVSSYIIFGYKFPFIATLNKPFLKYSLNNAVIPLITTVVYLWAIVDFQKNKELVTDWEVVRNISGFIIGMSTFLFIGYSYFLSTNKSIFAFIAPNSSRKKSKFKSINRLLDSSVKWYHFLKRSSEWKIETYLSGDFKIKIARSSDHYNRETLKRVFQQNHLNASFFELGAIATLLFLGVFMESPIFAIPAGASILLLFTMSLMLSGALHNYLKGWSILGFLLIFLAVNELSKQPQFRKHNKAYGLVYSGAPVEYSNKNLSQLLLNDSLIETSYKSEVDALNNWKKKSKSKTLFIVNTSGGGLRSAVWTYYCLAKLDSVTNNSIFHYTRFVAGASGGMIGAAFYRELQLRKHHSKNFEMSIERYGKMLSSDLLNSLSFSWVVNDVFRIRKFKVNNETYFKDRAYFFENQLNINTQRMLDKPMSFYSQFTNSGNLPFLLLTPTIINDGRRLMLSSNSLNFMYRNVNQKVGNRPNNLDFVDFRTLFKNHGADSMRFTTALRMNSTFPFVLPNIYLPTEPEVQVMDAGLRDNYGMLSTSQYLNAMELWLDSAIEKIVILRIYDRMKDVQIRKDPYQSLIHSLTAPVDHVYKNMFNTQRLTEDDLLNGLPKRIKDKIEIVDFPLAIKSDRAIPLSWQLTQLERNLIKNAFNEPTHELSIKRVKYHLSN